MAVPLPVKRDGKAVGPRRHRSCRFLRQRTIGIDHDSRGAGDLLHVNVDRPGRRSQIGGDLLGDHCFDSIARSVRSPGRAGGSLDWYVEGPGRRVGYDDLTAIDWIFEYTKERQRLRILYSTTNGLVGYVRQLLDASHVWVVLIFTGVAVGILAAAINIASDWLSDIKFGFCKSGEQGGQFYLNKVIEAGLEVVQGRGCTLLSWLTHFRP